MQSLCSVNLLVSNTNITNTNTSQICKCLLECRNNCRCALTCSLIIHFYANILHWCYNVHTYQCCTKKTGSFGKSSSMINSEGCKSVAELARYENQAARYNLPQLKFFISCFIGVVLSVDIDGEYLFGRFQSILFIIDHKQGKE